MPLIDHGKLGSREPVVREGDPVLIEAVGNHLSKKFGEVLVLHDRDSRWVHVDLMICPATATRHLTIVSTRPEVSWPFTLLRWLARMPHQTGTGFEPRESIGPIPYQPADQRPYPYEGALFLDQPMIAPLAMVGREVRFLAMCPIFADELAWIRREGAKVLLDAFAADEDGEPLLVDQERPSDAPA